MQSLLKSRVREFLGSWTPNLIGRVPYSLSLRAFNWRLRLACPPAEAWARHSYVIGPFAPFQSDLDLTLWLPAAASANTTARALALYAETRRLCLWWGELNSYREDEALRLSLHANPCELARDPDLLERLPRARRSATPAERGVFLLRVIESDLAGLNRAKRPRYAKWKSLFTIAGLALPCRLSPDTLLDPVLATIGLSDSEAAVAKAQLLSFYDARLRSARFEEIPSNDTLRVLVPHHVCFRRERLPARISEAALAALRAQLDWEVWGLQSQYRQAGVLKSAQEAAGFAIHLENLQHLANSAPGLADLSGAFTELATEFDRARNPDAGTRPQT